jgi:DNA-binding CsgD family transcriptional regulator
MANARKISRVNTEKKIMETPVSEKSLSDLAQAFGSSAGLLLASTGWVTYIVGSEWRIKHFLSSHTEDKEQKDYERHFAALDPLSPARCLASERWVATLCQMLGPEDEEYRWQFMKRHGIVDALEIFLKSDADIILGCSLLRHGDAPEFSRHDIEKAEALRNLGNFALSQTFPRRQASIAMISERFPALTAREATMVQLVAAGLSNKQLCRELDISLPTVKSHLLSAFRKMEVGSRTELAARVLA